MKNKKTIKKHLSGYSAVVQSGIPHEVCAKLVIASIYAPISIRGTDSKKKPNQRFNQRFDSKPTAIHQKSSNLWPCRGHISERDCFSRIDKNGNAKGWDPTDHSYGTFPKSAKKTSEKEFNKLIKLWKENNQPKKNTINLGKITEIRVLKDGRVCYSREMTRYRKAKPKDIDKPKILYPKNNKQYVVDEHDKIAKKYYIQETESISSFFDNVKSGLYEITNFKDGVVDFKYAKGINNAYKGSFRINLNSLVSLKLESKNWEESPSLKFLSRKNKKLFQPAKQIKKQDNMRKVEEITNWFKKNEISNFLKKNIAVFTVESDVVKPLMVQAGDTGFPVTGDFDLMHVGLPAKMPKISFDAPNTYAPGGANKFKKEAEILRDRLTMSPKKLFQKYVNQYKGNSKRDIIDYLKLIYKEDFSCLSKVKDYTKDMAFTTFQLLAKNKNGVDPMKKFLEPHWIHSQGKMHIGAYLMNCAMNIKIGKNMFNHGEESFNPGESEDFGALDHFYKGQIFHTDTEKECIDFFFHDRDYLKTQFINVHKSCLRKRSGKDLHLTKGWMNLIQVQVIHGFKDLVKPAAIEAYNKRAKELRMPLFENIELNKKDLDGIYDDYKSELNTLHRPTYRRMSDVNLDIYKRKSSDLSGKSRRSSDGKIKDKNIDTMKKRGARKRSSSWLKKFF